MKNLSIKFCGLLLSALCVLAISNACASNEYSTNEKTRIQDWGYYPIHEACEKNDISKLQQILINDSATLSKRTYIGDMNPLHCACDKGHLNIIEELLQMPINQDANDKEDHININAKNQYGYTALHLICKFYGKKPFVKAECKQNRDNLKKTILMLMEKGAKHEIRNYQKETAYECLFGDEDTSDASRLIEWLSE